MVMCSLEDILPKSCVQSIDRFIELMVKYFPVGPYLLIITKRKLVGLLNGHEIWRVVETDILPFPKTVIHLTEDQVN